MSRVLVTASADGLVRAAAEKLLAGGDAMVVHTRSTKPTETLDLSPQSRQYAEALIEDYAERTKPTWFSSVYNFGIAAGALTGGLLLPHIGIRSIYLTGAVLRARFGRTRDRLHPTPGYRYTGP
jgi:MFS family permease